MRDRITNARFDFPSPEWDNLGEAKDLITRLLEKDEATRISIRDALRHPFLQGAKDRLDHKKGLEQSRDPLADFMKKREIKKKLLDPNWSPQPQPSTSTAAP